VIVSTWLQAAHGVTGGAPLFVRGPGDGHVCPANSAAVLALKRTDLDRHPQRSR